MHGTGNSSPVIDIKITEVPDGFYILLLRKNNEIVFKTTLIISH